MRTPPFFEYITSHFQEQHLSKHTQKFNSFVMR